MLQNGWQVSTIITALVLVPRNDSVGPRRQKVVLNGPILSPSEFDPSRLQRSPPSPELDNMVHQVTAVLPQVPYTVIKRDLSQCLPANPLASHITSSSIVSTKSVDATITNLLEGRVKFIPSSASTSSSSSKGTSASTVFRRRVTPSLSQRQLSLEEQKRELLQNARRCNSRSVNICF